MPSLSRLLALALARHGWSQREFGRRVGVSSATVNRVLLGATKPRMSRAERWATALELTGAERRDFILAIGIANSPPIVRDVLAQLMRQQRRRPR